MSVRDQVVDHRRWGDGIGVEFGMSLVMGLACGYTWRLTSKVTASALVHAVVLYVGLDYLGINIGLTLAAGGVCRQHARHVGLDLVVFFS